MVCITKLGIFLNLGRFPVFWPLSSEISIFFTFFGQFIFQLIKIKDLGGTVGDRKRSPENDPVPNTSTNKLTVTTNRFATKVTCSNKVSNPQP